MPLPGSTLTCTVWPLSITRKAVGAVFELDGVKLNGNAVADVDRALALAQHALLELGLEAAPALRAGGAGVSPVHIMAAGAGCGTMYVGAMGIGAMGARAANDPRTLSAAVAGAVLSTVATIVQNEIGAKDAVNLVNNGVFLVSEGANMPTVPDGVRHQH